jgi:2-haloacid dehalogenase
MTSTRKSKALQAIAFDAYGTVFDVFSVTSLCDELYPGNGHALAQLWRAKQLQYSLLRSMMQRYKDFWQLTHDALQYAGKRLRLELTDATRKQLMDAYRTLAPFPDVKPGLEALTTRGLRLVILSNGEPNMLNAAIAHAGLGGLLERIISVDEVRVFKPNPRVYRLIAHTLKVSSNRIGFVSSNSWDVSGAESAGLCTYWLRRSVDEPEEELGYPARNVVSALTELEGIIT